MRSVSPARKAPNRKYQLRPFRATALEARGGFVDTALLLGVRVELQPSDAFAAGYTHQSSLTRAVATLPPRTCSST